VTPLDEPVLDERAMMLAVQKPQILADGTVNGTDFVTVGFKTGPNAFPYDYNVKCYNTRVRSPAPSCADIAASGNAPIGTIATGDLPYKYSKVAVNVTDLDAFAADCFVTVTGTNDKDSKCKYAGRQVFTASDEFATLYYTFQGTGSDVQNFAANPPSGASTGTIFGTQRQASNGECAGSLVGSGGDSDVNYMNTNWNLALQNQWTLSFRLENVPLSTSLAYFLGEESTSFRLFTGGIAGAGGLALRCDDCDDVLISGGATPAPTMVTFVYDSVAGDVKAYLNGALVRTVSQSSSLALVGSDILKVGGKGTSAAMPDGALLSDFRLYADKALTASEVASLYSRGC
jgi:hypothetical protein